MYFKQTYQTIIKGEYPHIPAVVDVVSPHNWICVVLNPDAGERVPADLVILIGSLGIICHIQSYILTIRYITMSDYWIRTNTTHTDTFQKWLHSTQTTSKRIYPVKSRVRKKIEKQTPCT